jgi:hypothetical protein
MRLRGSARWAYQSLRHLRSAGALTKFGTQRLIDFIRLGGFQKDAGLWIIQHSATPGDIARLCDLHGSDKGTAVEFASHPFSWTPHTYADFYEFMFSRTRDSVTSILECGIGTNNPDLPSNMTSSGRPGASLRVWRDFFPNATIYGVDIDRNILFSEDRIRTGFVDQNDSESFRSFVAEQSVHEFDIIIDDGLHEYEANKNFFEAAAPALSTLGIYVIEDCSLETQAMFQSYFAKRPEFDVMMVSLFRKGLPRAGDNRQIVVRRRNSLFGHNSTDQIYATWRPAEK